MRGPTGARRTGPGTADVVARTVAGGRAEGRPSGTGTGLGGLVHMLCTAVGLSLRVARSAGAFNGIGMLGQAAILALALARREAQPGSQRRRPRRLRCRAARSDHTRRVRPAQYGSRRRRLKILPVSSRGSCSCSVTTRGTLKPLMRSRSQSRTASAVIVKPGRA